MCHPSPACTESAINVKIAARPRSAHITCNSTPQEHTAPKHRPLAATPAAGTPPVTHTSPPTALGPATTTGGALAAILRHLTGVPRTPR
eukprot:2312088-Prymnesium_polylepis.1